MEQGDTPESHSTAFHYRQTPGGPSVGSGAQAAAGQGAGGSGGHQAAAAEGAGGGGERQQAGAEIQLPPAFVRARSRMQAVQAAGPLPTVVGMQTTGTAAHHSTQGMALWAQAAKANPYTYVDWRKERAGAAVGVAKMLMLQGDFSGIASVPAQLAQAALEQLVKQGHLRDTSTVYLCMPLLRCYLSPTLPAPLLGRWEEAGLVARSGGDDWVAIHEGLGRYPLVIRAQPNQTARWEQLSQLKFARLAQDNAWLRQGLGLLGLRLREAADPDGAVVCSVGGNQYVYTALGESLWHDSMQAVFGSLEAAHGLEVYWTTQPPKEAGGGQAEQPEAPEGWQLRRVDMAAGQQQQQG